MSVHDILGGHLPKVHYGGFSSDTRSFWWALRILLWFRLRLKNIVNTSRLEENDFSGPCLPTCLVRARPATALQIEPSRLSMIQMLCLQVSPAHRNMSVDYALRQVEGKLTLCWLAHIRPASIPFSLASISMIHTPVIRSPFIIACCMGAAPRYLGRRDGWMFSRCCGGNSSRIESGRMRPNEAVIKRWSWLNL